jgi:hypothetical protein
VENGAATQEMRNARATGTHNEIDAWEMTPGIAGECKCSPSISLVGQITKNLSSPVCKNIPLSFSPKSPA